MDYSQEEYDHFVEEMKFDPDLAKSSFAEYKIEELCDAGMEYREAFNTAELMIEDMISEYCGDGFYEPDNRYTADHKFIENWSPRGF